jgi:hypothetical protein
MEWISVEDRLPDNDKVVLVWGFYEHGDKEADMIISAKLNGGLWLRNNVGYGFTVSCHPTHWMSLPKHPDKSTL